MSGLPLALSNVTCWQMSKNCDVSAPVSGLYQGKHDERHSSNLTNRNIRHQGPVGRCGGTLGRRFGHGCNTDLHPDPAWRAPLGGTARNGTDCGRQPAGRTCFSVSPGHVRPERQDGGIKKACRLGESFARRSQVGRPNCPCHNRFLNQFITDASCRTHVF